MQAGDEVTGDRAGPPALPALARRILTLSLRINAADSVYQRHMQSTRRERLAALAAVDYEAVRIELIRYLEQHDQRAHHLQGGGLCRDDATKAWPREVAERPTALAHVFGFAALAGVALGPYRWGGIEGEAPAWDAPPLRALAMYDSPARDLSAALLYFMRDVRGFRDHLDIDFYISPVGGTTDTSGGRTFVSAFEHDYLWFNSTAVLQTLTYLVEGYQGVIKTRPRAEVASARWTCAITEHSPQPGGNRFQGLQIEILQVLDTALDRGAATELAEVGPVGTAWSSRVEILLPPLRPGSGENGALPRFERTFDIKLAPIRRAGGHVGIYNGALEILIPARSVPVPGGRGTMWAVDVISAEEAWSRWLRTIGKPGEPQASFRKKADQRTQQAAAVNIQITDPFSIAVFDTERERPEYWRHKKIIESVHIAITGVTDDELSALVADHCLLLVHGRLTAAQLAKVQAVRIPVIEISGGGAGRGQLQCGLLNAVSDVHALFNHNWGKLAHHTEISPEELIRELQNG